MSKPPAFPMKFKVFLRWMVPDLRHYAARLHLFRQFLYAYCKAHPAPPPESYFKINSPLLGYRADETDESWTREAEKTADNWIAKWSRDGIGDPVYSGLDFFEVRRAIKIWRTRRLIQQRRDARASRTLKNYRKKILWLLQTRTTASRNSENVISLVKPAKKVQSRKRKSAIS